MERILAAHPSGGDLAAILQSGIVMFRKNKGKIKLKNLETNIPEILNNFLLVDSGKPVETTAEMVKLVNQKYESSKTEVTKFLQSQSALTTRLAKILKKGETEKFFVIIKKTEKNLEKLGVVGNEAKTIIRKIILPK